MLNNPQLSDWPNFCDSIKLTKLHTLNTNYTTDREDGHGQGRGYQTYYQMLHLLQTFAG